MARSNSVFVCSNCGNEFPRWSGQCPSCDAWNTLEESEIYGVEQSLSSSTGNRKALKARTLSQIDLKNSRRISSGFSEFDRVLGGTGTGTGKGVGAEFGFLEGEVVLISGDPGIGKSTLLLQVLASLAEAGHKCLYASAEESEGQIAVRAKRIFGDLVKDKNFRILSTFDVDSIIDILKKDPVKFLVVDSIQTVSTQDARGISGGISQVKASAVKLVNFAKMNNISLLLIGHITKEGNIAGPKTLEHLVDAVFQIEGDERNDFRLVRSLKNRFGTTNEVGILSLGEKGMEDVRDAGKYFTSDEDSEGVARSAILEGNRVLVVEIQALTNTTVFTQPKRVAQGISASKLQVICAILQKHAKVKLYDKDVYVNVAGGLNIKDPAVDLAVALAIASSVKSKKIKASSAVLGELSLTGKIGPVSRAESRVRELKRLGYSRVLDSSKASSIAVLINQMR